MLARMDTNGIGKELHEMTTRQSMASQAHIIDAPSVYPYPKLNEKLLPWRQVDTMLGDARNYWLATSRPDGRPHVTPLWGAWIDEAFYFQGAPDSRWAQNLALHPAATVHLESGDDVVIVDGIVAFVITDQSLAARLIEAWRLKYGAMEPAPATDGLFVLQPRSARAWGPGMQSAARWTFAGS